jgi:glucose-6-phosphate isomerase
MDYSFHNKLKKQAEVLTSNSIRNIIDTQQFKSSFWEHNGVAIDFSKNKITDEVFNTLLAFAESKQLDKRIEAMFAGEVINVTEQRPALHTLCRAVSSNLEQWKDVEQQHQKAARFADKIRQGELLGATGKPISTLVNIGIGGSDLGPRLLVDALSEHQQVGLNIYFMSDVDHQSAEQLLSSINLEQTLFILCSKSFTTWETQTNAQLAISALKKVVGEQGWSAHFAGVAVNQQAMTDFGILPDYQFSIWDWVGGRYSIWSSIGLIVRIALGNAVFDDFLAGGRAMDQHFLNTELSKNLPVLLALIQHWNINYQQHSVFITLPYRHGLKLFPDYQQQLEMESNGKSVTTFGEPVFFATCPYIFGQSGLNAQHAFMQLVHQSQRNTYLEMLTIPEANVSFEGDVAFRSCLAQSSALMNGTDDGGPAEKACPGDRPSTIIVLEKLSAFSLGQLIALYEHKVFVQSVLWDINAFDQFGVELGKQIATGLSKASQDDPQVDAATRALIKRFGR